MKALTVVGIVLILLGIVSFATGGFSFTHEKNVVDAGPIKINKTEKESFPVAPVLSGIAVVAGLGLVFAGAKSK